MWKILPEKGTEKKTVEGQAKIVATVHMLLEDRRDGQVISDGLADVMDLKLH